MHSSLPLDINFCECRVLRCIFRSIREADDNSSYISPSTNLWSWLYCNYPQSMFELLRTFLTPFVAIGSLSTEKRQEYLCVSISRLMDGGKREAAFFIPRPHHPLPPCSSHPWMKVCSKWAGSSYIPEPTVTPAILIFVPSSVFHSPITFIPVPCPDQCIPLMPSPEIRARALH